MNDKYITQTTRGGKNMFQTMKKRIKNEKGLTLIELLAVIVILAVIAAIAIPAIGNIIANSKYNAVKSDALNIINAAQLHKMDNGGEKAVKIKDLVGGGYLETPGTFSATEENNTLNTEEAQVQLNASATVDGAVIKFEGATVEEINKDKVKGKDVFGDQSKIDTNEKSKTITFSKKQ